MAEEGKQRKVKQRQQREMVIRRRIDALLT
jgi:hypothetical protein